MRVGTDYVPAMARLLTFLLGFSLCVLAGFAGLFLNADRQTGSWWRGDAGTVLPLARTVAERSITGSVDVETGSELFNGEWTLVTCQMTNLGLAAVIQAHPESRDELLPAVEACAERLLEPSIRRVMTEKWDEDGLSETALGSKRGHAYLGWLAIGLSAARTVIPDPTWAAEHDRLIAGLDQKMSQAPADFETYPYEIFPADIASVIAAVALHEKATGKKAVHLESFIARYRETYEHESGWIRHGDAMHSEPRGATTAVAAWYLGYADPAFSRAVYEAHNRSAKNYLGFGGMREYLPGTLGFGDMDSGPVVLDMSVAATGFSLAGARQHGDETGYRRRLRTARLFGVWSDTLDQFIIGGPLGDALLLAALTTAPLR